MSIPGAGNPLLLGGVVGGYQIERSLRFNSADSAYLSRTPSTAGNRKTWTWAAWVKRSGLGQQQRIFSNGNATPYNTEEYVGFQSDGTIEVVNVTQLVSVNWQVITQAVFRDVSAFFHLLVRVDTTKATPADRVVIFINGEQITTYSTANYPSQNSDTVTNSTSLHNIGIQAVANGGGLNSYLADIHFIDGQALDPTSFGEFDDNGVWQPIEYTGTYGTNGFHLPFSDNSTAAALGTDNSGNSNTWTVNNISVTAGVGNDSLVDSPTNYGTDTGAGGEVRGNYATLNPLDLLAQTLANGNLQSSGSTEQACVTGTVGISSGKWYWEVTAGSAYDALGIWSTASRVTGSPGSTADSYSYYANTGNKFTNNAGSSYGSTFTAGDVIGIALDLDVGTLTFYKNNVSQGVAFSGLAGGYRPAVRAGSSLGASTATYFNFGQRPFAYTAPSGYKALCTTNLPTPTIADGSKAMDVALYTGNGSTQAISGLGFSPDLVWIKERNAAADHALYDIVRGTQARLESNTIDAEATSDSGLTAFNSDGFALSTLAQVNTNNDTYVAWTWDAGSSTVTNTQGSITSSVRANASAGFSVAKWSSSSALGTVGHGLGVAPSLIIAKCTNTSSDWWVYHAALGNTLSLGLNTTSAATTNLNPWNNTSPTASVFTFTLGQYVTDWVSYNFAPVAEYSSFGSYTGNGSTDGAFVYTGFRPRWILYKPSNRTVTDWVLWDTARNPYNIASSYLLANTFNAEGSAGVVDILSNGFKLRVTSTGNNGAGDEIIYAAFAENPFKYARAR